MTIAKFDLFKSFFQSERSGGFVLIGCTILSLIVANTTWGTQYQQFWSGMEHWVNDGLMAIFFLLVGLEIERELYVGELSSVKNALLPVIAAAGGMLFPALIHFVFNAGSPTADGFGIPMATDIAFALGILSLLGNRVPLTLKIFLTALAIIDDLGAITVIAIFYSEGLSAWYLGGALLTFLVMFIAGKKGLYNLLFYLVGGVLLWYLMLKSGVHATIAGVLLAFAIPFHKEDAKNPSYKLQHALHYPVAFFILPVFALANTAITFPEDIPGSLTNYNAIGIMCGLIVGKFMGIFLVVYAATKLGIARLSPDLEMQHILGISLLGGIGFTMSIFITNLAFNDPAVIISSKMSIILASTLAAIGGYIVLKRIK